MEKVALAFQQVEKTNQHRPVVTKRVLHTRSSAKINRTYHAGRKHRANDSPAILGSPSVEQPRKSESKIPQKWHPYRNDASKLPQRRPRCLTFVYAAPLSPGTPSAPPSHPPPQAPQPEECLHPSAAVVFVPDAPLPCRPYQSPLNHDSPHLLLHQQRRLRPPPKSSRFGHLQLTS